MAELTKAPGYTPLSYINPTPVVNVSLATVQPGPEHTITGLWAGETIQAGDACYIKQADGRLYRSLGAAANAAAVVDGFAAENCDATRGLTLYRGVHFNYSAGGLQPGTSYYLSGTVPGGLTDAPSTGGTTVIARSIDASKIYVRTSY